MGNRRRPTRESRLFVEKSVRRLAANQIVKILGAMPLQRSITLLSNCTFYVAVEENTMWAFPEFIANVAKNDADRSSAHFAR